MRYTLNFPSTEINGQTAVFNLHTQLLEYPGDQPVRPLKKDNFGPRFGWVPATDAPLRSAGYGLVWIEMAGITTPFTTPSFPFLQTVSQRALDTINPPSSCRTARPWRRSEPTPPAGLGQGVFSVDAALAQAMSSSGTRRFSANLTSRISAKSLTSARTITHVGIPDTNLNQLTVDQLALGNALLAARAEPILRHHSSFVVARRSDDSRGAAAQAVSAVHDRQPVPQQRGHHVLPGLVTELDSGSHAAVTHTVRYTRSQAAGRCLVGVRRVDPDGPVANFPVADSFNRSLERDYSTGDIPHCS